MYYALSKDPFSKISYHSQFDSMINKERQQLNENLTLKPQMGNEEKDKIYFIKMKMLAFWKSILKWWVSRPQTHVEFLQIKPWTRIQHLQFMKNSLKWAILNSSIRNHAKSRRVFYWTRHNMASKHTRECPTPSVIGEIQIQSSGRDCFIFSRKTNIIWNMTKSKSGMHKSGSDWPYIAGRKLYSI